MDTRDSCSFCNSSYTFPIVCIEKMQHRRTSQTNWGFYNEFLPTFDNNHLKQYSDYIHFFKRRNLQRRYRSSLKILALNKMPKSKSKFGKLGRTHSLFPILRRIQLYKTNTRMAPTTANSHMGSFAYLC